MKGSRVLAPLLVVVGLVLLVAGVAMWSVPAALVVAGALLAAAGLLVDFAPERARTDGGGG